MRSDLLPHWHCEVSEYIVFHANSRRIAVGDAQFYQLAGLRDGEGAQSHRVQNLEDGGVCANTERKRGDHDERKAWTSAEDAQCTARILPQTVQPQCRVFRRYPLAHGNGTT